MNHVGIGMLTTTASTLASKAKAKRRNALFGYATFGYATAKLRHALCSLAKATNCLATQRNGKATGRPVEQWAMNRSATPRHSQVR
jgi:hypothetical protein